jgi:antirestriction protein ArdC
MARDYWVFNAHQVEGYKHVQEEERPAEERINDAEEFFRAAGVKIADGGNRAYYLPSTDAVYMPPFGAFAEPISYYSVLSHETTHYADTGIMPQVCPGSAPERMKPRFRSA